jgi:hypothetical protein
MRFTIHSIIFATAMLAGAAQAQVAVDGAWVRTTVPAQKATGAFMRLQAAQDSKLVSASSSAARAVEVHEMSMQHDVMKMRQVPFIALPAGKAVELKPGGYHLMLLDLNKQVKDGDTVPLTLVFEGKNGKRQTVEIQAPARAPGATAPHDMHQH